MLAVAITVEMILLVVGGAWWLSTRRLEGIDVKQTQLVSENSTVFEGEDLEEPTRIFRDGQKLKNAVVVVFESLVVAASAGMVAAVLANDTIPVYAKGAATAVLVVGALLVARAMYVRLGLYHPALETISNYRSSLADTVDDAVASDFAAIHGKLSTARGEDVDEVTVGLLAAAKNEGDLRKIAEWGEDVGIADAEEFEDRAHTLAEADLIEYEEGQIRIGEPLEDADEDQIATVAASVLN